MGEGTSDEALLSRYSRAQARLETRGGYLWRDRAVSMARGLGFGEEDLDRGLDTFSGGQLTRASLARALATSADVLLLDEPTNHLDIESLEWLEQTLVGLDAAIVLVAHDRWFLEAVGTAVLEIEAGRSRFFSGTWHQWRREQAAREMALGKAIDKQQAEIERMERFIERFRAKATKARQAQSRVKKLSKIERIERGVGGSKSEKGLEFEFSAPERSGRVIFELLDGSVEVGKPAITLLERRRIVAGARRARLLGRAQRDGQDDVDRDASRAAPSCGRQAQHRAQREARLPLSARRGAGRGRPSRTERIGGRGACHGIGAEQGAGAARALSVLWRGGRETLGRALRWGAPAPVAGCARRRCADAQCVDPRRADKPSRHRVARGSGGCAACVSGRDFACLARPGAARRGGHAHRRCRGSCAAQLRGRLARVRAGA